MLLAVILMICFDYNSNNNTVQYILPLLHVTQIIKYVEHPKCPGLNARDMMLGHNTRDIMSPF